MNLLTRLHMWRCARDGFDEITPLNTTPEWEHASRDTLAFHWLLKRPLRMAARAIRVPASWLARLDGNPKILHEIVTDVYLKNERQARRRSLLQPIIEYGLCLCAYDNNYAEVFNAVLNGIILNRDRFVFDVHQCNPDNWFADNRGRIEVTQAPDPFRVISITDSEIYVDQDLGSKLITVTNADGSPRYLGLDTAAGIYLGPKLYVYPILASGRSVLDVAPSLMAVAK